MIQTNLNSAVNMESVQPFQAMISPLVAYLQPLFKEAVDMSITETVEKAVDRALQKYSDLCKPMETYTRQQVCDACHITLPTFHAWVNKGILKTSKVNGRILVSKADLEEVIKEKKLSHFEHED